MDRVNLIEYIVCVYISLYYEANLVDFIYYELSHHISKAVVANESKAILKYMIFRKQKACSCAPSTTGAAYAASGVWRA